MQKTVRSVITAVLLLAAATAAQAASVEELEKQVEELAGQVRAIKATAGTAANPGAKDEGVVKKALEQTRFGGYGELDYIFKRENGNGKGGNTFDPHRFVLYVNSPLADWVTLNAELEWEHGGDSSEKNGEVAIEQAFLDFTIARPFNIKAGVLLVPLGAINPYHEPTNFNSTERPELDRFLIPSTWREMGAGIHGALGSRVNYELLVMNGLDGSKFSAKDGIRKGRQDLDGDVNRNKAVVGRLEIRPATNLYTNFSFYTGNSAKVGTAYTTIAAFDGRYSIGIFDIAGEYVHIYQDNPGYLGVTDIGNRMSGYWVEGACHVMPKSLKKGKLAESDAVLFARYSEFDTQQGNVASGISGLYDRNYTTFGVVFKPVTTLAIKADYQIYDDHRGAGELPLDNDKFQLTLGFVF
ncbi:MAG: porin [Geobacteraceae bacterium]